MIIDYNYNSSTKTKITFLLVMIVSLFGFFTLFSLTSLDVGRAMFHKYHTSIFLVRYGIVFVTWVLFIIAAGSMWEVLKSYYPVYNHTDYDSFNTKQSPLMAALSKRLFLLLERDTRDSALLEHYRMIRKNNKAYMVGIKKKFKKSHHEKPQRAYVGIQERNAKKAMSAARDKLDSMNILIGALELNKAK